MKPETLFGKGIVGIIILVCLIISTLVISNADTLSVTTDKETYMLGETVNLTVTIEKEVLLNISSTNTESTYTLDENREILFTPQESGVHNIILYDTETREPITSMSFGVLLQLTEQEQPEEAPHNQLLLITNSTGGNNYTTNDSILFTLGDGNQSGRLIIVHESGQSVFSGPIHNLSYLPMREGFYEIILEQKHEVIINQMIRVLNTLKPLEEREEQPVQPILAFKNAQKEETILPVEIVHQDVTAPDVFINLNNQLGFGEASLRLNKADLNTLQSVNLEKTELPQQSFQDGYAVDAFAMDLEGVPFTDGVFTKRAKGTALWKCAAYTFETRTCSGSFEKLLDLRPGEVYNILITPEDPLYVETGVASINTQKPQYHPGETVILDTVVLDTFGHLVGYADVAITITTPTNKTFVLQTSDSSLGMIERGIYRGIFTNTSATGTYLLQVNAEKAHPFVNSTLASSFLVTESYPVDIIRTIPITTDPFAGPFEATITLNTLEDMGEFSFTEVVPSALSIVSAPGATQTTNGSLQQLTWTGLNNGSSVYYVVQPPLVTPDLYKLGPSMISYWEGEQQTIFTEARPWYVAIDPTANNFDAQVYVYATNNNTNADDDTLLYTATITNQPHIGNEYFFGHLGILDEYTVYRLRVDVEVGTEYDLDADYFKESFFRAMNNASFSLIDTGASAEYIVTTDEVATDGFRTEDVFYMDGVSANYSNSSAVGEVGSIAGDPDIVVIYANALKTYENPASGELSGEWTQFVADADVGTITMENDVVLGDLDNDGDLDAVIGNDNEDIRAFRNNGDPFGTAWTEQMIDSDVNLRDVEGIIIADFDNDGWMDICGGIERRDDIYCYQNDQTPWSGEEWTPSDVDLNTGGHVRDLTAGDINGDGFIDLIGGIQGVNDVTWWENDGSPWDSVAWAARDIDGNTGQQIRVVAVADLDQDGDLDVLQGDNGGDVEIYENDGADPPSWTEYMAFNGDGADDVEGLAVADIDNDGDLDIIYGAEGSNTVGYLENNGSTWYPGWTTRTIATGIGSSPWEIATADFDGDGWYDVVAAIGDNDVALYLNNHTPAAGAWPTNDIETDAGSAIYDIFVGDLDQDNQSNILEFHYNSSENLEATDGPIGSFAGLQNLSTGTNHSFNFIFWPDDHFPMNTYANVSLLLGEESYGGWTNQEEKADGASRTPIFVTWEWLLNYTDVVPPNLTFVSPTQPNGSLTTNKLIRANITINETNLGSVLFNLNGTNYTYWSNDLVLFYPMENVSALGETDTYVVDMSKQDNNGTAVNDARYSSSFVFDGAGDYIEIPADASLDVQNFTFAAWFRSTPASSWTASPAIFMRGDNGGQNELFIGFDSGTDDSIYVFIANSPYTFDGNVDLLDQQWHHIAVTYNTSQVVVYIDGQQYASPASSSNVLNFGTSNAWIGADVDAYNSDFGNYWNGYIDDVQLWNRSFTPAEITGLTEGTLSKKAEDLWMLYVSQSTGYGNYTYQGIATDHLGTQSTTPLYSLSILPDVISPEITFVSPTPTNGEALLTTNVPIAINVTEANIAQWIFDWNGTNRTIFNSSVLLFFNMDNRSALGEDATTFVDLSLYGLNGSGQNFNNDEITAFGKNNGGVNFDGSNDIISVPANNVINSPGDKTVMFWFNLDSYFDSSSGTDILAEKYSSDSANMHIALAGSDYGGGSVAQGSLVLKLDNGATYQYLYTNKSTWDPGTWYHFAWVVNTSDASQNKIYINAVNDTQFGVENGNPSWNFGGDLHLGGRTAESNNLPGQRFLDGTMDDVMIWNTSLTQQEINEIYSSELTRVNAENWTFSTTLANREPGYYEYQSFITDVASQANQTIRRNMTVYEARLVDTGPSSDVSIIALDEFTLVFAWIDAVTYNTAFEIWHTNGTRLVDETSVDTDGNSESRVDLNPINETQFVLALVDGPEDDLDFFIYDENGNEILGRTQADPNIGSQYNDVQVAELGDRFVICNANDADNDADYEIWWNDGTLATSEINVDGNMAPEAIGQNLIGCAAVNGSTWVYTWFDDASNDASLRLMNETGGYVTGQIDFDTSIGEEGQIAVAGLKNNRFAVAYYDQTNDNMTFNVREYTGFGLADVIQTSEVATNLGGSTKLAIAEIDTANQNYFVVVWQDNTENTIKATVYSDAGNLVTAPFNITTAQNSQSQLVDVVGYYSTLGFGLCDRAFAVAYTNSSNATLFETYDLDGSSWHGVSCDKTPPTISFIAPTEANATVSNGTEVVMNISITEADLSEAIIFWNNSNTSIFNESLIILYNFDNRIVLGDNATYFTDASRAGNDAEGVNFDGGEVTFGKYRYGIDLDGVNDYITSGDINTIDGATELTVMAWVYIDDVANDGNIIAKDQYDSASSLFIWRDDIADVSGRQDTFSARVSSGGTTATIEGTENLSLVPGWHHIAMTFDGGAVNGLRLFIDGVEDVNSPVSTIGLNALKSTTYPFTIGAASLNPNSSLDGRVDQVQVWTVALSPAEINEHYYAYLQKVDADSYLLQSHQINFPQSTYTYQGFAKDDIGNEGATDLRYITFTDDPVAPVATYIYPTPNNNSVTSNRFVVVNTSIAEKNLARIDWTWNTSTYTLFSEDLVLYYQFNNVSSVGENDGYVVDMSPYTNDGTAINQAYYTTSGYYGGSFQFEGSTDYVEMQANSTLDVQNFTFAAWFRSTPASSWTSYPTIFMRGDNSGNNELLIGMSGGSDTTVAVLMDNTVYNFPGGIDILDQQWHHLMVTYNGTTILTYVDGAQFGSPVSSSTTFNFGTSNAWIGTDVDAYNSNFGNYWNGYIDDVQLWNISMNTSELGKLYTSVAQRLNNTHWYVQVNETNLSLGTYTYEVYVEDVAKNNGYAGTRTLTIIDPYAVAYNSAIDVATAALDNTTIVYAWIDAVSYNAYVAVWGTNGSRVTAPVQIDSDGDAFSRIGIAPISTTRYVVALGDGPDDSLDLWIYNKDGSVFMGRTEIDSAIGANFDVGIAQIGDRFMVCNANDADNDADFRIFSNTGSAIGGEQNVDGNIAPGALGQNLVDCSAVNSSAFVYARFDDPADDVTAAVTTETGTTIAATDINTNAGDTAQVDVAGLRDGRFAFVYYDSAEDDISYVVNAMSGAAITPIQASTDIETSVGGTSRVAIAEVDDSGESNFVIVWQNITQGAIAAATFDNAGAAIAGPFTVTTDVNINDLLIDVVGYYSTLGWGLCDESFVVSYANSSNITTYKGFKLDGSIWDGSCEPDTTPPVIILNAPNESQNFSTTTVMFNWTATDNEAINMSCNLIVDGVIRAADIGSLNNTPTNLSLTIASGTHYWNVTCSDDEANTDTSETRLFRVNILSSTNNVTLPALGDFGTLVYADATSVGTPLQRNWTGYLQSEEILAPDLGPAISWERFVCSKVVPECYLVASQTDNSIDFAVFDLENRVWHNQTELVANRGLDDQRTFDIACEDDGASEDCLIVYDWQNGADADIAYRVWNSSGLSAELTYTVPGAVSGFDFRWVSLYPQKATNTIAAIVQNDEGTRDIHAIIWDGDVQSFSDAQTLTDSASGNNRKQYDCAWEGNSGQLLCAYGLNSDDLYAYMYDPGTSSWSTLGNIYSALNAQAREITLCGETPYTDEFTHDYVGVMTCDQDEDRDGGVWDGSSFSKTAIDDAPGQDTDSECDGNENDADLYSQHCSFEKSGNQIVFTWVDANTPYSEGGTYTIGDSSWSFSDWGSGMPIGASGTNDVEDVKLIPSPGSDELFFADQDVDDALSCALWTGRAFDASQCGDYESSGSTGVGAYYDFDWIRFDTEPAISFNSPYTDTRTYTFAGHTAPSTNNVAWENYTTAIPPLGINAPLFGTEASSADYVTLATRDDTRWQSTVTTVAGDHITQSFRFEVFQATTDIDKLVLFHEGYATATTFQTGDPWHIYIYNYTADNYTVVRTVNAHSEDMFTEVTITEGINDYVQNGFVYVLLEGDHATGVAGDARADMHTDYIELQVQSIPHVRQTISINVTATDKNGIAACHYQYHNTTQFLSANTSLDSTNDPFFVNTSDTTVYSNIYHNITAYCKDTFDKENNATQEVFVDNVDPKVFLATPNMSAYFNTSNITFVWNGTDNSNGVLNCSVAVDGIIEETDVVLLSGAESNATINNIIDGIHNWTVSCYDTAGNSNTSSWRNFTVDAGAPTVSLNSPPSGTITAMTSLYLNYTPTDALGVNNCSLILNGVINQTNTTIANGVQNQFVLYSPLDGIYAWQVNCTDDSGYMGESEVWNITLDTTPPSIDLNTTDGILFSNGTATLNYTVTDALDASLLCNITIENVVEDEAIISANATLISRNVTVPDGIKFWNVTCIDDAGNWNISETRNFTLAGPPYVELISPVNLSQHDGVSTTFTYFVQDGDGLNNCSIYLDDILNQTDDGGSLNNPGNNSFIIDDIPVGIHNWTVYCEDTMTTTGYSETWYFFVDQTPPSITLNTPANGEQVLIADVGFNFTATDNYASSFYCNLTVDGSVALANSNVSVLNNTLKNLTQTLSNGNHNWNVTCWDNVGNSNTSATWSVSVVAPMNVTVETDKPAYQEGQIVYTNISTTNTDGIPLNTNISTDFIYTNQSISGASWWNTAWKNRIPVFITDTQGFYQENEQISVNITGLSGAISSCDNEIRVVRFSQNNNVVLPANIVNGDDATYCEVTFLANITSGMQSADDYFVYYNNSASGSPGTGYNYSGIRVQRDSISATGTTVIDLMESVNRSRSFILFTANTGNSAPDRGQLTPNLSSDTVVSFSRYDGVTESDISWQVIEHKDIVVQRGEENMGATEADVNVTIDAVDLSNAFIIVYGRTSSGSAGEQNQGMFEATFLDDSTIRLRRASTGNTVAVSWQVVEWPGVAIQNGTTTFAGTSTTTAISSIDMSRSLLVFGAAANGSTSLDNNHVRGNISTTNQVAFTKVGSGGTIQTSWFVLTFPTGTTVQRGTETLAGADAYVTINEMTTSESFHQNTWSSTGGGTTYTNAMVMSTIVDGTNMSLIKETTSNTNVVEWQVLSLYPYTSNTVSPGTVHAWLQTSPNETGPTGNTSLTFNTSYKPQGNYSVVSTGSADGYSQGVGNTSFTITSDFFGPVVFLVSPENYTAMHTGDVTLVYNASDYGTAVANCSLIINGQINQTNYTIDEDGANEFDLTSLNEGRYLWTVSCSDTFGNTAQPNAYTLLVDDTGPIVSAYDPNETTMSYADIDFNFSVVDNVDDELVCTISVNDGDYSSIVNAPNGTNTTEIITGLADGFYYWNVTCVDEANNEGASTTLNFSLDSAPLVSLDSPGEGFGSTTGNLTFTYFVTETNLVNCSLLINEEINQTANAIDILYNDSSNTNNFTLDEMAQGVYNWSVMCMDTNNFTGTDTPRELQVDFGYPSINLGSPIQDEIIYSDTITFNFTATDAIDPILSCNIYINDELNQTGINATNATETLVPVSGFLAGNYSWNVTCADNAGFSNVSQTWNYSVSPDVLVTLDSPDENTIDGDGLITLTYTPSSVSGFESGGFCVLYFDGQNNQTDISVTNGAQNSFIINVGQEGVHTWQVNCTDDSINKGGSEIRNITVDLTDPVVVIYNPNGTSFSTSSVLFNWSVTDNYASLLYCNVTVNGTNQNPHSITSINNSFENYTYSGFTDGLFYWNSTCMDQGYRTGTSITYNFTVQEPPSIQLDAPIDQYRSNELNMSLYFTPDDNSNAISSCTLFINSTTNETESSIVPGSQHSFNLSALPDGNYSWNISCVDPAGNTGANDTGLIFYVDLTGPTLVLNAPNDSEVMQGNDITFNWTATDFTGTQVTCNLTIDGTLNTTNITGTSGTPITYLQNNMTDGGHNWSVLCIDDLGNPTSSATRTFVINQPDLWLQNGNISFNDTNPDENATVMINVSVANIGGNDATGVIVAFWDGNPATTGVPIGNTTITVETGNYSYTNMSWTILPGFHELFVLVDPANVIGELNETNNNATANLTLLRPIIIAPVNGTLTDQANVDFNITVQNFTGGTLDYRLFIDDTYTGISGSLTDNVTILETLTFTEGLHYVILEGRDGLARLKNTTYRWITVDLNAPTITIHTPNATWFTNASPVINFTVNDAIDTNISYRVFVNGTVNTSGYTPPLTPTLGQLSGLTNGSWEIIVEAYDDAGNGQNSTPIIIYVDSVSPVINLTYPPNASIFTSTSIIDLNMTVTDNLAQSLICNLTVDGSLERTNSVIAEGVEINATVNATEGDHYWNATCIDQATNSDVSETRLFSVFIPPEITLQNPPNGTYTNNGTVNFSYYVADDTGIENCSIFINGVLTQTNTSVVNNAINNFTVTGLENEIIWSVVCVDNTTQYVTTQTGNRTVVVDLHNPVSSITTVNETLFNDATPEIAFNITDNLDQIINYTFYVDDVVNVQGTTTNATPDFVNLTALNEGTHELILEAQDDANNTANSTAIIIYIDYTSPNVTLFNPLDGENLTSQNVSFNFTVTDNFNSVLACNLTLTGEGIIAVNATNGTYTIVNLSNLAYGYHYWNVTCIDNASNVNTSETRSFLIPSPDLVIANENISVSNSVPTEGENITISAIVHNIGLSAADDVVIQFWRGHPDSGGTQINGNFTANFSVNDTQNFSVNYTVLIGLNDLYVIVDPPLSTNGSIGEANESNNIGNLQLFVGEYHTFAGNTTDMLHLDDSSLVSLVTWLVENATGGHILVSDTDSLLSFTQLRALSRDTSNVYQSEDFTELDGVLNMSNASADSINNTWTTGGSPYTLRNITLFNRDILEVPTVNSTNTTNFFTGILWDESDGGTEYTGSQDVVFVSQINKQTMGQYGLTDFEIKVPARLRSYQSGTDTVSFYVELP